MDDDAGRPTATPMGPMVPARYRVIERRDELADTVTLWVAPVERPIVTPTIGQFNMLWAFGVGEAPISLAGIDGELLMHTIRDVGAVTTALCSLRVGDELGLRGPFGRGWDLDSFHGRDVLVVAGGIGIAPVRPIITELFRRRTEFGDAAALLVGARTPDDLLYMGELEAWRRRVDIAVEITVDTATPDWQGDVGVVTTLIDRWHGDPATSTAFVCGPEVMMRFTAHALVDRGIDPDQIILTLERNMHCAIGHCGHCQLGPLFVCKDGPVARWPEVEPVLRTRER